ncbi:MAG TPA: LytTR family transcriptional regulator [Bacteroidetes bacterium]|nr:LytTR family transcriptional regulator [Bacteroidota bacterium]
MHHAQRWIALPQNGSFVLTDIRDIMYCEADGNYTMIFLKNGGKYLACRKLGDVEKLLPATCFVRIHHAHLVNLCHVRKYHKGDGGQVELRNGIKLDVSRRKKQGFMERLIVV